MEGQSQLLNSRDQRIIDYLKIRRSNFGEVCAYQLLLDPIEESKLRASLKPERIQTLRESLIQYKGNIAPIIVTSESPSSQTSFESYKVLCGQELVLVAKDFVAELGTEQSQQLEVDRLKVWMLNIKEHSTELHQLQTHLHTVLSGLMLTLAGDPADLDSGKAQNHTTEESIGAEASNSQKAQPVKTPSAS